MSFQPPSYDTGSPLPNYQRTEQQSQPPAYNFPTGFNIGSSRTEESLVSIKEISVHLRLLGEFASLRKRVDESPGLIEAIPAEDKDRRWAWFGGLAVERFELWCKSLTDADLVESFGTLMPPVDVVMVWHAYLLNPRCYYEDINRIPCLTTLGQLSPGFNSALVTHQEELFAEPPGQERVDSWEKRTSTPFDPFSATSQMSHKSLACPQCTNKWNYPYIAEGGTGFLQQNFSPSCPACAFKITRTSLVLRRLVNDLILAEGSNQAFVAGTFCAPSGELDLQRATRIREKLLRQTLFKKPDGANNSEWASAALKRLEWSDSKLAVYFSVAFKDVRLSRRITNSYPDEKFFSVGLVGAVLRQGSFIAKMHDLNWTKREFLESPDCEHALLHSSARYHAFLDLLSSSPASFFVPTLDIDLAWHTHQLSAVKYRADCLKYVGRFIDHDDKNQLSSAFDITCRAWKNRFHIPYTYCGCPPPGERLTERFHRILSSNQPVAPSYLNPPRDRDDSLAATHPSDHNAVVALHHKATSEASQKRRMEKIAKRLEREKGKSKKGRSSRAHGTARDTDGSLMGHHPAFLMPIPMYYHVGAGCTAGTGHVVDGGTGTAGACAVLLVEEVEDVAEEGISLLEFLPDIYDIEAHGLAL